MFTTEIEAALAYDKVAAKIPRRNLNFVTKEAREDAMVEATSTYVEQPVQCDSCLKMFTSMKGLEGHMGNCKGDEDNFIEKRSKHSLDAARKSANSMNFVNQMTRLHNSTYDPDYAPGHYVDPDGAAFEDAAASVLSNPISNPADESDTFPSQPPRQIRQRTKKPRKISRGYEFVQRRRIPSPADADYGSHRNIRLPVDSAARANYYTTEAEAPAVLPHLAHVRCVYDHHYGVPPLIGDIH